MKPIVLEMTAFGSYSEYTCVDFRKLQHDLYLITGDTGAGKTTIFDGIMFALFGKASGEENAKAKLRSRSFEMMHCDYVDKSVDTVVKLTFEQAGKEHVVERVLHFSKNRATGQYEKSTVSAKLKEYGKDVIEKNVTDRIEQILGMNAEQFRKIVMLAQGEFKKFLEADSEKKNEILGTLFDSSDYVYYQNLLAAAKKKLMQQRNREGYDKIKSAMESFHMPEGISEEEKEIYIPEHSELESRLCELEKNDREKEQQLNDEVDAFRSKETAISNEIARAEVQNNLLKDLEVKLAHQQELTDQKEQRKSEQDNIERIEKVIYQIKPTEQEYQKAKKEFEKNREEVKNLKRRAEALAKDRDHKKKVLEEAKKNQEAIHKWEAEIQILTDSEQKYQEYDRNRRIKADTEKEKRTEGKNEEKYKERLKTILETLQNYEEELRKLENSYAELVRADTAYKKAKENLVLLTGDAGHQENKDNRGIRSEIQDVLAKEKSLENCKRKLAACIRKAEEEKEKYDVLYSRFLKGQARVLSAELKINLDHNGEANCPVCNTRLTAVNKCSFEAFHEQIQSGEEVPDKSEVDKAKKSFESVDKQRETFDKEKERWETELLNDKRHIVQRIQKLRPEVTQWEQLSEPGYIDKVIEEYRAKEESAKKALDIAEKNSERYGKLNDTLIPEQKEKKELCEESIKRCEEKIHQSERALSGLESTLTELQKSLKYHTWQEAQAQIGELEVEKKRLQEQIDAAQKNYDEVIQRYHQIKGELEGREKELPDDEENRKKAEKRLLQVLAENSFEDMDDADRVLKVTGGTAPAEWIKNTRNSLKNYEIDVETTGKTIAELQEKLKGKSAIDVKKLREELEGSDGVKGIVDKLKEKEHELEQFRPVLYNHQLTLRKVREAKKELARTEAAWQRIEKLADLATGGHNAQGGKLSFERYVMGYVFREILDMANRHLDIMSGGRYELQHEVSARKQNQTAGLEIYVLDQTTGKTRDSVSLSGGESFLTSLALALGLSDVVQNRAGGYQLDALFIDEGFGSLDGDVLDKALTVLNGLTEGHRMVGIISHVDKLEESISQKIIVRHTNQGSVLDIVN